MEKFILMYCQDRELSCRGVFDTHDAAFAAMKDDFDTFHKEEFGWSDLEVFEAHSDGESCELNKWGAWSNLGRVPMDWQIDRVEIPVDASTNEDA